LKAATPVWPSPLATIKLGIMNQTILLGNGSTRSVTATRWAHIFLGLIFIFNAFISLKSATLGSWSMAWAVLNLVVAIYSILLALLALSKHSSFSPKVKLTDSLLILKPSIMSKSKTLAWSEINQINYGPYTIKFLLTSDTFDFEYRTSPSISIKIKERIREMANSKNIEVTDG
jgi:hypothetical protein